MASFFNVGALGINPFSTAIGQKIEQATDGSLPSENWALNMEICDMINESSDSARDAMKAIRKRLTQNAGKNNQVIVYTLIVLETCVKNCGKAFHLLVAQKDFIQELVKLIGPKNDPPQSIQDKVLTLIQTWAETFRSQPDLNGVVQVYTELKNKGIEFPATGLEPAAPIYTPERSVPDSAPTQKEPPQQQQQNSPPQVGQVVIPNGSNGMPQDQIAKIQSELEIVSSNMAILAEMLNEMKPGQENPDDYKLLVDLTATCKEMQSRIVELIGRISNDEITAELLRLNDELNNLFLRQQRYEKNRDPTSANGASPSAILGAAMGVPATARPSQDPERTLIDLSDGGATGGLPAQFTKLDIGSASTQLSKIGNVTATAGSKQDDEFDMLAQSRKTDGTKVNPLPTFPPLVPDRNLSAKDSEFDEMAQWLDKSGGEETVTSTEFDKFLAERAAAADNLPTLSDGGNNQQQPTSAASKPTKPKKDEENLLAL
ncbi:TOM1L2 family protein [Megaselia abdita]